MWSPGWVSFLRVHFWGSYSIKPFQLFDNGRPNSYFNVSWCLSFFVLVWFYLIGWPALRIDFNWNSCTKQIFFLTAIAILLSIHLFFLFSFFCFVSWLQNIGWFTKSYLLWNVGHTHWSKYANKKNGKLQSILNVKKRSILFTISGKMGTVGNLLGQQNPLKRQRHRKGRQVWIKMNVKSWRKNWQDKSDMCAKWNFYPSRERAHKTWVYLFYRCSYFRIALIFFASAFSLFNLCYWCSVLKK